MENSLAGGTAGFINRGGILFLIAFVYELISKREGMAVATLNFWP